MLILVPVPLGNAQDLSFHAKEILSAASTIIVEEFKESSVWLRAHGISGKNLEKLNEHSTDADVERLAALCKEQDIPLITDCGTPGFCDPGANLVAACRKKGISVKALPGPSSLMMVLSLSSVRLDEFVFRGFLPAENEARKKALLDIQNEKRAMILMDTPYRFEKTLKDLQIHFATRKVLIAGNLTGPDEFVLEGKIDEIISRIPGKKAEFMVLIYPVIHR